MSGALVSGWVGADNVGDELIFRSLRQKLERLGVRFAVMSVNPERTYSLHGVDVIDWRNVPMVAHALRESTLILGPGGILQDETSVWNLPAHLHRALLARIIGAPIVGIGLGAGPLRTRLGRTLTRRILQNAPLVVRDYPSASLLKSLGLQQVHATTDLSFGLAPPEAEPAERIVVSVRPFSGTGGLRPARASDHRVAAEERRLTALARALDQLSGRTNLPIHLLALEPERDAMFHEHLRRKMKAPTSSSIAHIDTVLDEVARSRLVVGMRYHAIAAAILAGRPCVAIAYSPKVRYIAEHLGSAGVIVPNTVQAFDRIAQGVELIGRDALVERVRAKLKIADRHTDRLLEALLTSTGLPTRRKS